MKNKLTNISIEEAEKLIAEGVVQEVPNKNIDCWKEELEYLLVNGDTDRLEDFIRNLLSDQRSNLVKEIEGLKNKGIWGEDSMSKEEWAKRGFSQAISEVISLIEKYEKS